MRFSNKGLLIPRVALTSTTSTSPITTPVATSLLVYNTATTGDVTPGYYYWTGSKWMRLLAIDDKPAWLLSGNAGTTAGTNFIGTTDEEDVVFKANSTEIMRITSKRYVGIGTAYPTAYPSGNSPTLLHIYDPGSSTTDFALLQLGAYKSSVNGKVGEINFHANIAATDRRTACVESYISNVSGSNVAGDLRFSTNNLGGCAERMRIDPNGNVGIGTTSPSYKLHTVGDIYANGGWLRVSGDKGLYFESWGGGFYMTDATWIRTYNNKNFYHNTGIMRTDGTFQVGDAGGTFNVVNGGNLSYRTNVLFANTAGNVGIGTASPSYKLDISGDTRTTGKFFGHLNVDDTRNANDPPTTFNNEVAFEFKQRSTVGVPGSGTYSGQITLAPWGDNSGNASHQINFNEGGIYWRQGQPDAASWGSWTQILTSNIAPTGNGTLNYVPKWTPDGTTLGNSQIYDDGANVGIGTASPTTKLTIAGGHGDTKLRLYSTGDGGSQPSNLSLWASEPGWTYVGTGIGYNVNGSPYYGRIDAARGSAYIRFLPTETKFEFQNSSGSTINNVMVVEETGRVGIGTDAPTQNLHVVGNIRATDLASGANGAIVRTNANGDMAITNFTGSASDILLGNGTFGSIPAAGGVTGSGVATRVAFWTGTNTLSSNTNLYWDNTNSRLGVGTSAPSAKLEIRGTADLTLRNDQTLSNSGDDLAAINLGDAYSGSQARILVERGAAGSGGDNPTDISFWNTPDGSVTLTERMRIRNDGNVGIGTTSPTKKLQVNGTFGVDIDNNSNSPPHTGYVASTDIAYSRDDISGWTTLHGSGVDDEVSSAQSIGFTFNLFGTDYTTFYVSTNGFIAFGSAPGSSWSNSALPTSTFSMPVICPYWNDMQTRGAGIRTTLLGTSPNRVRIIDFELETHAADYYDVTFQVILHEKSNLISIRYYVVAPDACGQSATIGIQGPGGSVATAVPISCNAKVLDDNFEPLSISFCPVIY
jgi:hypothetical protein